VQRLAKQSAPRWRPQYSDQLSRTATDKLQLSTEQQAEATLRRSWTWRPRANKLLPTPQTQDDIKRADAVRQRAAAYLQEGTALARIRTTPWLQYQAQAQRRRRTCRTRSLAEKQFGDAASRPCAKLAAQAAQEQQRLRHDEEPDEGDSSRTWTPSTKRRGEVAAGVWPVSRPASPTTSISSASKWMAARRLMSPISWPRPASARVSVALEGGVSKAEVGKLSRPRNTFAKFRRGNHPRARPGAGLRDRGAGRRRRDILAGTTLA